MKPYRANYQTPATSFFTFGWRPFDLSDRGVALAILAVPFVVATFVFVVAVVTTLMGPMAPGSFRFYAAALSYTTLTATFMCMPAYVGAVIWFWWKSQSDDRLARLLWQLPLIAALLVWFPILVITPLAPKDLASTYAVLVVVALTLGYLWVALVRFCLRYWRNV